MWNIIPLFLKIKSPGVGTVLNNRCGFFHNANEAVPFYKRYAFNYVFIPLSIIRCHRNRYIGVIAWEEKKGGKRLNHYSTFLFLPLTLPTPLQFWWMQPRGYGKASFSCWNYDNCPEHLNGRDIGVAIGYGAHYYIWDPTCSKWNKVLLLPEISNTLAFQYLFENQPCFQCFSSFFDSL